MVGLNRISNLEDTSILVTLNLVLYKIHAPLLSQSWAFSLCLPLWLRYNSQSLNLLRKLICKGPINAFSVFETGILDDNQGFLSADLLNAIPFNGIGGHLRPC